MSDYALTWASAKTKRVKRRGGGRREYVIVGTGGFTYQPPNGRQHGALWTFLFTPRPINTTLHHPKSSVCVDVAIIHIHPWLAWRPWRIVAVADDYDEGLRFIEQCQA